MKGICFIDGENTYTTLGIFIIKGSYDNLVAFPPAKESDDKNDWPEEDGIEIDLSSLTLNTYELSIDFACKDDLGFSGLVAILSDMGYHDFYFPILDRTYRLRLSSQNSYTIYPGFQVVKITFANDFPREANYEYQEPVCSIPLPRGYEIDDRDLSEYGVVILKGSNAEILKSPAVKKNLLQNFKRQDGAVYDGEIVKFQTKEVSLKCLMRATDIRTFWQSYDALLYDLTKLTMKTDNEGYEYSDAERVLYCDGWSESYPCYYKDCQTNNFMLRGGVWWEFTLNLVFTCFRIRETEFLLSSEAGEFVITENGEFYIDLN